MQHLQNTVPVRYFRLTALPGSLFEEVLRRKHHDDDTGPVGDGVTEEGSGVRIGIRLHKENKTRRQDARRGKAERMAFPEWLVRLCCFIFSADHIPPGSKGQDWVIAYIIGHHIFLTEQQIRDLACDYQFPEARSFFNGG